MITVGGEVAVYPEPAVTTSNEVMIPSVIIAVTAAPTPVVDAIETLGGTR